MDLDRKLVRYAGAAMAAAMAVIYYLIGAGVLTVVTPTGEEDGLLVFGILAGTAFAAGAALLLIFDARILWIAGALFQVLVVLMYIAVAPQRDPHFEVWGITLRLIQIPLIAGLLYLAIRAPHPSPRATRAGAGA